jgi:cytochrome P450
LAAKAQQTTIFDEILNDDDLPAQEKTVDRLTDEATILVIAASETPAKVLALIMYYVLVKPDIQRKLRDELSNVFGSNMKAPSYHQLEQLPYLSAVVKEGLRLHGGIVARSQRISRYETLHCAGFDIPPGTPLSTSSYFVHRDPTIFPNPSVFDPDRWLRSADPHALDRYLVAFGKGSRNCVGKNLGQAELFLTLATVLRRFDLDLYETDETDVTIERDWYVMQPKKDSLGVRAIVKKSI